MEEYQAIMDALDAIAGSQGSAYVTIDGNRYCLMQLTDFEASIEINVTEVPILGKTGKGNKPNGWTGTWTATAYYNQSILRKVLLEYKNTGRLAPMEFQITNHDQGSRTGRQTTILKNCLLKGGTLALLKADSETLTEDIEGTFDDWEQPESFALLPGMLTNETQTTE